MTTGWGASGWGSTMWGLGGAGAFAAGPPTIYALDPVENATGVAQLAPVILRVVDDIGAPLALIRVTVNGQTWVLGGNALNGATLTAVINVAHGYDLKIDPPAAYPYGSRQDVQVSAEDVDGNVTLLNYVFTIGVGRRLLQARNPLPSSILAYFNGPMQIDSSYLSSLNWHVTAVTPGALPIAIVAVATTLDRSNMAHLTFVGGSSGTYRLSVMNVVGQGGAPLERGFTEVPFQVMFGDEEEPKVSVFKSVFGPLGMVQRVLTRRTMDGLVMNRALALGLDEQFRLRGQQLETPPTTAPGARRV